MCFRELGRQFTFHLALLEKHALITTGPYSIVRHPSYTAAVIVNIGIILWHTTPGSWLRQSGLYMNTIVWVAAFLPAIMVIGGSIILGIMVRPQIEDELLKKEFGKKWDEWAKRVPYRIIPGVY
jgi:protein-S-isoprenylcysteine O-methyltransferase Ste14